MKRADLTLSRDEAAVLAPLAAWAQGRGTDAWLAGEFLRRRLQGRRGGVIEVLLFRDEFDAWVEGRSPRDGLRLLRRGDVRVAEFVADGRMKVRMRGFDKLIEDCFCRDFTVNALFYSLRWHKLKDFCGGAADLQARLLRPVMNFETTFHLAPERLIGAAALIAEGFALAPQTEAALRECFGRPTWEEVFPQSPAFARRLNKLLSQSNSAATLDVLGRPLFFPLVCAARANAKNASLAWAAAVKAVLNFEKEVSAGSIVIGTDIIEAKKLILNHEFKRLAQGITLRRHFDMATSATEKLHRLNAPISNTSAFNGNVIEIE